MLDRLKWEWVARVVCVFAFLIGGVLLNYKYFHLGYYDWDLAFFTQACWQLLHGSQFVSIVGINYFGDHSYFITLLTLPIFALFQSPLTLVYLKLAAFVVAAYLLYKIASKKIGQGTGLALMILYIIFPANIFSLLYDFNPECFAPPILFWMFMSFDKQRWKSFFIASIFLLLIKENMALVVCAFGVYALLNKNYPKKQAWVTIFLGCFVFYVFSFHIIPYFRNLSHHAFVVRYGYLGNSLGEILLNVLTKPSIVASKLFSPSNANYILQLFGLLLIPACLGGHILFLISPILLQHLLSTHPPEHSIYYHYGATMAPFIFLAVLIGLKGFSQKFGRPVFIAFMCILFIFSIANLYKYKEQMQVRTDNHGDHLEGVRWAFINSIPADASVIASFDFLAPLSLREHLYAFHKVYDDFYQNPKKISRSELNTLETFKVPEHVKYALIDLEDPWLQHAFKAYPQETSSRVKAFLEDQHWTVLKKYGTIMLLKR